MKEKLKALVGKEVQLVIWENRSTFVIRGILVYDGGGFFKVNDIPNETEFYYRDVWKIEENRINFWFTKNKPNTGEA